MQSKKAVLACEILPYPVGRVASGLPLAPALLDVHPAGLLKQLVARRFLVHL